MASITLKNVTKIYRSTEKERGGLFRNKKVSEAQKGHNGKVIKRSQKKREM